MRPEKEHSTKDLILSETLKILGTEGPEKITIRRIAQKSGVNVASVNYHFGSKEVLIGEAMKLFGIKMKDIFPKLKDSSVLPETRLRVFLEEFSAMLITYPGFMKGQVKQLAEGQRPDKRALENMKFGKEHLCLLIEQLTGVNDNSIIEKITFQLMAGIILPVLHNNFVGQIYNIDISQPEELKALIDISIEKLLAYGRRK